MVKGKRYSLGAFMEEVWRGRKCREYLAKLRWPEGFVCAKCGCCHAHALSNGRYQCTECRHQISVTAGTVLHKGHMPLTQVSGILLCQSGQKGRFCRCTHVDAGIVRPVQNISNAFNELSNCFY